MADLISRPNLKIKSKHKNQNTIQNMIKIKKISKKLKIKITIIISLLSVATIFFGIFNFFIIPQTSFNNYISDNSDNLMYPFAFDTKKTKLDNGSFFELKENLSNDRGVILYLPGFSGKNVNHLNSIIKNHNIVMPIYQEYEGRKAVVSFDLILEITKKSVKYLNEIGVPSDKISIYGDEIGALGVLFLLQGGDEYKNITLTNVPYSAGLNCYPKFYSLCDLDPSNKVNSSQINTGKINPGTNLNVFFGSKFKSKNIGEFDKFNSFFGKLANTNNKITTVEGVEKIEDIENLLDL